jgi:hypothetical protein
MRIVGMNKSEVVHKYPVLKEYTKSNDFISRAYRVIIDKITDGLNLSDCKMVAKEKLDSSLVHALSVVEDFKRGSARINHNLDDSIVVISSALEELKSYFYTPPIQYRTTRTLIFLKTLDIEKKKELSRVIWLMTGFYIYPETWINYTNEIVADKIVFLNLRYTEKHKKHSLRINLREYLLYQKQASELKIVTKKQEKDIIDIVNYHFGFFKISSVFATEIVGDQLMIYSTRNRKERIEINLFQFEDYQQLLGE